jgi:hypothetical protein
MRRTLTLAALTAGIAAAAIGPAAANAQTIGFGPGPLGTGYIDQNTINGKDGYVNVNGDASYTVPSSLNGCSMYCANTLYGSGSVYQGTSTGTGFSLFGQIASPLPYHAFSYTYSTLSGPYLSYN